MIRLQSVQAKDRELFWNINQKYLYEMTNFYDDPMDESGNYHYGHFEEYFSDPKRIAYFIFNDGTMVGFAMICPYSNIGQNPDFTMAEFTIFPSFRKKHLAFESAKLILERHPGKWEIKYNEKNDRAKELWDMLTVPFETERYSLNEEETVLSFETVSKTTHDEIHFELQDTEWTFEFTDHDRTIVRAIVFDDDGFFYFVRANRDDEQLFPL